MMKHASIVAGLSVDEIGECEREEVIPRGCYSMCTICSVHMMGAAERLN